MSLQQLDQTVLYFLNGLHNTYFDAFFWCGTEALTYLPLYAVIVYLLYKQFGKKIWIPLAFLALTFLISDLSCNFIKQNVERLRPTNNPDVSPLIHIVNGYRGGQYSFPSAHACNTFAASVFLCSIVRPKNWVFTLSIFLWAGIMSYSRIYLGVHYPFDILAGSLFGTFWGVSFSWLMKKYLNYRKNVARI